MQVGLIATAPLATQVHLATVLPAFVLGGWLILFSAKGSRTHRSLGALYPALMTMTAVASLFIRDINHGSFSLIHLFVPLTLSSVVAALWHVRRRNIRGHRITMIGLYVGGLLIAGAFSFTPGRLMHRVVFG